MKTKKMPADYSGVEDQRRGWAGNLVEQFKNRAARKELVMKDLQEKKKTKPVPENHSQPSAGKMKKSKTAPSMAQKYPPHHKQYPIAKKLTREISALKSEVVRIKLITSPKPPLPITYAVSNPPPPPPTYVPTWPPINDRLEMPDE